MRFVVYLVALLLSRANGTVVRQFDRQTAAGSSETDKAMGPSLSNARSTYLVAGEQSSAPIRRYHAQQYDGASPGMPVARRLGQPLTEGARLGPEEARSTIGKEASQVIDALKTRDMSRLASLVHPTKGLRFSPIATVDTKRDVVLTPDQLKRGFDDSTVRIWGVDDGSGAPIRLTFSRYFRQFVYNRDFTAAKITYNSSDEGAAKASEAYPRAIIVDYYLPETETVPTEHLRLVFDRFKSKWYLLGLIHDGWTI